MTTVGGQAEVGGAGCRHRARKPDPDPKSGRGRQRSCSLALLKNLKHVLRRRGGAFPGRVFQWGSSSGLLAIWHCLVVTVCGSGHRMFVFVIDGAHKQTLSPLYAIFFPWISWSFCRILVAANDAGVLDRSASVCFQCCQESFLLCSHLVRTQMEW